jgi:SAM-dependent methyltransferase
MAIFDDLADIYESMVDWPRRLANEEQFFRRLFAQIDAKRVLDAACGTGRHAAMFHSWGLRVQGADISQPMIDRARAAFGESDSLRWTVHSFEQAVDLPGEYDAVICTGNSLALAADIETARRAVREMLAAVRPGGLLIVHLLNPWRLPDGPIQWQKCRLVERPGAGGERAKLLVLRGIHRHGPNARLELLAVDLSEAKILNAESTPLLCLAAEELQGMALDAGAAKVELYGDYQFHQYVQTTSVNLILVAWKHDAS